MRGHLAWAYGIAGHRIMPPVVQGYIIVKPDILILWIICGYGYFFSLCRYMV